MQAEALRHAVNPVAFFANGIGDTLLTLPALRALAQIFQGRLTLACDPQVKELLLENVAARQTIAIPNLYTDNAFVGRIFDCDELELMIRETDLFISLVPWCSPSLTKLLRILPSAISIGLGDGFDVALPISRDFHSADLAFGVPAAIKPGLRLTAFSGPPSLPAAATAVAQRLRQLVPDNARVLVVHADTAPAKCWDAEKLTVLLDLFISRYHDFMIWLVGFAPIGHDLEQQIGRSVSFQGMSLNETLALVGEADLFLGIDSCILHAADLFRVPGVGLFGPTDCREWGFRFGPHRHVQGAGSMDLVTVETALEALSQLVEEHLANG